MLTQIHCRRKFCNLHVHLHSRSLFQAMFFVQHSVYMCNFHIAHFKCWNFYLTAHIVQLLEQWTSSLQVMNLSSGSLIFVATNIFTTCLSFPSWWKMAKSIKKFLISIFLHVLNIMFLSLMQWVVLVCFQCIDSKSTDPMTIFFTSGTSGSPKMTEHTHSSYPLGHLITSR